MIVAKAAATFFLAITTFISSPDNATFARLPESEKQSMLDAVNRLRAKGCHCGRKYMPPVGPIRWNAKLEKAALVHAKDMESNGFFGHTGSDGSSIGKRADRAGYKWRAVGENIAEGYGGFQNTLLAWKDSPGHCRNLMNPGYDEMGVAMVGDLWVQDFGASAGKYENAGR
ncbi:MAG: CAP domain-containing protein [Saprospiraceae bacterium]|nr:CAP domain-containing protein [Saprospiraceae bacterium]